MGWSRTRHLDSLETTYPSLSHPERKWSSLQLEDHASSTSLRVHVCQRRLTSLARSTLSPWRTLGKLIRRQSRMRTLSLIHIRVLERWDRRLEQQHFLSPHPFLLLHLLSTLSNQLFTHLKTRRHHQSSSLPPRPSPSSLTLPKRTSKSSPTPARLHVPPPARSIDSLLLQQTTRPRVPRYSSRGCLREFPSSRPTIDGTRRRGY